MARRTRKGALPRALQRALDVTTGQVTRTVSQAVTQALQASPTVLAPSPAKRAPVRNADCRLGVVVGLAGARRYWLYKPPALRRTERLPLVVMLHGSAGRTPKPWLRAAR
jgi:poly(3-hydroxybutyrate) depolymerase